MDHDEPGRITRRDALHWGAIAGGAALVTGWAGRAAPADAAEVAPLLRAQAGPALRPVPSVRSIAEASIADLRAALQSGYVTSRLITQLYLDRIRLLDKSGPRLNSVIEVNPDALRIADALDEERRARGPRGPLHGIPMIIKDNIDTADRMQTTAGSLALVGAPALQDATVAARLRAAGVVILGKANLSEWANFRSTHSTSGWSGRGGQVRNPNVLDRNPSGSSSGSAVAVAASLCAAALGTETNGSILSPSGANGVVGIKPTVGLTSRAGVVPIAHSQDTVGPFGRTVADAAMVLGALTGLDPRDPATAASAGKSLTDYTQFLDAKGLRGARIGVARAVYFGVSEKADAIIETAIQALRDGGAVLVDPADIPTARDFATAPTTEVLLWEFKADLNAYLATRGGVPIKTLADLIAFNEAHRDQELRFFGQELAIRAQAKTPLTDPDYLSGLATLRRLGGRDGIDAAMDKFQVDAIVAPTRGPAPTIDLVDGDHPVGGSSTPAAVAGYPVISVPAGYTHDVPVNINFMGRAWSEPVLIKLAYAFEQATKARRPPRYRPTVTS